METLALNFWIISVAMGMVMFGYGRFNGIVGKEMDFYLEDDKQCIKMLARLVAFWPMIMMLVLFLLHADFSNPFKAILPPLITGFLLLAWVLSKRRCRWYLA